MIISQYGVEDFVCNEGFQQYCTGENSAQVLFWEQWLADHPQQAADIAAARELVNVLNAGQGNRLQQLQQLRQGMQQSARLHEALGGNMAAITQSEYKPATSGIEMTPAKPATQTNFGAGTLQEQASTEPAPPTYEARRNTRRIWAYTAVAASLLVITITTIRIFQHNIASQPAAAFINSTLSYASGNAERKTVVLPDGTVMTLRRQSKVLLDAGFNQQNRVLTLEGEAFFDVKHEAAHPFIVHTKQVEITVLGTVFNVNAYPANATTETSLFRGQVSVSPADGRSQAIILEPNQKLVIGNASSSNDDQSSKKTVHVQALTPDPIDHKAKEIAWVRNRLEIENEPLVTIAGKLEKWYGIPVVFTDPEVQQYRYSGTFESETIIKALEALQLSYPFNFRMEHDKIIISK